VGRLFAAVPLLAPQRPLTALAASTWAEPTIRSSDAATAQPVTFLIALASSIARGAFIFASPSAISNFVVVMSSATMRNGQPEAPD
jgi:hypothetical protein